MKTQLRGIVVAADSQEQALDHFRAVASGSNVQMLKSEDSAFCIAVPQVHGMQLMNPLDGNEMVVMESAEAEQVPFTAVASSDEVDATYIVCSVGCGSHIISDNEELLARCPACASNLHPKPETDMKKEIFLAFASSQEDMVSQYRKLLKGEIPAFATVCDEGEDAVTVISNQPLKFDVYRGLAASDAEAEYMSEALTAVASAESVAAHYFTTASAENQVHVMCSDESPLFCPETSSGLIDPEPATASSEDDEDEDDEEEEEESEEDDDSEEDEEEDEDEDEDESEEDEELTLSLASATTGGAVKKQTATASAEENQPEQQPAQPAAPAQPETPAAPAQPETQEEEKQVAVAASFVAIAANDMTPDNVEIAYAGSIQRQPTWVAFYDGIPFAKATAANSKNEFIADPVFGEAFTAATREHGVAHALREFGFDEIKPQINVSEHVAAEIQSQVESRAVELATAATQESQDLAERYEAAMASAAQGINKGFFPDLKNPIRVALASTLDDLGISGGDALLQQAFVNHSDDYNKMLLAKASDIIRYDGEVQNQLAAAINQIQEVGITATASSLSVGKPVGNKPATPQHKEVAVASSGDDFSQKLKSLKF